MADRGAEDAGLIRTELVRPDDDAGDFLGGGDFTGLVLLFRNLLGAGGESLTSEHLNVVVEFFVDGGPISQALHDRVLLIGEDDADGLLRAVAGGLQAEHFEPAGVIGAGLDGLAELAPAVAVHGAMEVHGREAILVGVDDIGDVGAIIDAGGALVVDDHVEVLAPIGVLKDFKDRLSGLGRIVGDLDGGVNAGFDTLLQDFLLVGVIVAAAAGDDEDAEGLLHGRERGGQAGKERQREEGTEFHGGIWDKGQGERDGQKKTYFLAFGATLVAVRAAFVSARAALTSSSGMGCPSTKA